LALAITASKDVGHADGEFLEELDREEIEPVPDYDWLLI
jgi:hypothetical protein